MYNRGIHLEKKKKQYQPIHFLVTFKKKKSGSFNEPIQ